MRTPVFPTNKINSENPLDKKSDGKVALRLLPHAAAAAVRGEPVDGANAGWKGWYLLFAEKKTNFERCP
jgi:hypothetical protein